MEKFKNRTLDVSRPVKIYRCLNRTGKVYSIQQDGLVVGHTSSLILKDCSFKVNQSAKRRCIETGQRNVHAFMQGQIGSADDIPLTFGFNIKYNPFDQKDFYTDYGFEIKSARAIHINSKGIFAYI